jgi:hypothetical protein
VSGVQRGCGGRGARSRVNAAGCWGQVAGRERGPGVQNAGQRGMECVPRSRGRLGQAVVAGGGPAGGAGAHLQRAALRFESRTAAASLSPGGANFRARVNCLLACSHCPRRGLYGGTAHALVRGGGGGGGSQPVERAGARARRGMPGRDDVRSRAWVRGCACCRCCVAGGPKRR